MDKPFVSIIIPTYNSSTLRDCLESIEKLDYSNFEVIVVNDGGRGLSNIGNRRGVKFVELKENIGPGLARNKGAECAKGTILAFVDSDCIVHPQWLSNLVNKLSPSDIGAVTGYYKDTAMKNFIGYFQLYETLFRLKDIPAFVNNIASSNLAVKRNVFEEVGGFGPQRVNEDMELGYWISRRYKIYWDKDNGITHFFRNSITGYLKQQFFYASSVMESIFRYPEMLSSLENFGDSNSISIDISTCALAFISGIWCIVNMKVFPIAIFFYILWILAKMAAIRFHYIKAKNIYVAFKTLVLYYLRDISWTLGLIRGVVIGGYKRFILRDVPPSPGNKNEDDTCCQS